MKGNIIPERKEYAAVFTGLVALTVPPTLSCCPLCLHRLISPLITGLSFHRPHCGLTRTNSVCVSPPFFPSFPGYHSDFDLHQRHAHLFLVSWSLFNSHVCHEHVVYPSSSGLTFLHLLVQQRTLHNWYAWLELPLFNMADYVCGKHKWMNRIAETPASGICFPWLSLESAWLNTMEGGNIDRDAVMND